MDNAIIIDDAKMNEESIRITNYSDILKEFNLIYAEVGPYFQVGEISWKQGWIFHMSSIWIQLVKLLRLIIPILLSENVPFQIVKDLDTCRSILSGHFGLTYLGKIIAIYPRSDKQAVILATRLIEVTAAFKGPHVLTNRHLGSIVYTRYGTCNSTNETGSRENYIINSKGILIKDKHSIPFILPNGIEWPFNAIVSSKEPKKETVLRDKYKPFLLLKSDAKGDVKKVLRLEKWYKIKWAVMKEGRYQMIADFNGRDAGDRLRWQFELHKDLEAWLPIPKVYDLFEEEGNTYLVMEFIRGDNLDYIIQSIFQNKLWDHLPLSDRLRLLHYTIQILNIIKRMHEEGYIHRDITPLNFLVDKNQNIWMIDLELAFSNRLRKPFPPFDLGTAGFMSPEQLAIKKPTTKQDVFSIGCTLICLLTGLLPGKFALEDINVLKKQLTFFIPSQKLINLIADCLQEDPGARPDILLLLEAVEEFKQKQINHVEPIPIKQLKFTGNTNDLLHLINNTIHAFSTSVMMNGDKLWFSKTLQESGFDYYQVERGSVYAGFSEGLSGVLYTLASARKIGISIESCLEGCDRAQDYLKKNVLTHLEEMPAGLYMGTTGVAVALSQGLRADLVQDRETTLSDIHAYLENQKTTGYSIATGISGKGLGLLHCASVLNNSFVNNSLRNVVDKLISVQEKDGSWVTKSENSNSNLKITGFGHGVAGIVSFLLEYQKIFKDEPTQTAAIRGLQWLIKQSHRNHGQLTWTISNRVKQVDIGTNSGIVGIALVFLKAYEIFSDPIYKDYAERILRDIPVSPVNRDLTLSNGLIGIGELYIEALKILKSDEWGERAGWIVDFLMHHYCYQKDGSCYWILDLTPISSANLMMGNSGIVHFLMRAFKPDMLMHPLLPS